MHLGKSVWCVAGYDVATAVHFLNHIISIVHGRILHCYVLYIRGYGSQHSDQYLALKSKQGASDVFRHRPKFFLSISVIKNLIIGDIEAIL